ncbi:MAG TPA: DEAD/DEAH box helicase, partial [Trueperaceae bacterium]|nr:DEAD/DEAH box helicase [Trueperaceae bacterium]
MPKPADQSFHAFLTQLDSYEGQVAAYQFMPPRKGEVEADYRGPFAELLERVGIRPYAHQARAFEAVGHGRDVVVATATASGKSLTFQVPVLAALARGRTSLLLYPTKALAADAGKALGSSDP